MSEIKKEEVKEVKKVAKPPVKKATPVKSPAAVKAPVVAKPKTTPVAKATTPSKEGEPVRKAIVRKPKVVVEKERGMRKVRVGVVVSNKMDKTIVVSIENKIPHPLYKKIVVKSKKFKAHDEKNECNIGDVVEIVETRPLSKDKHFRLLRIVEKAK
jgi:small subunit ribosomal protein S17